jgi:hypothetical protein
LPHDSLPAVPSAVMSPFPSTTGDSSLCSMLEKWPRPVEGSSAAEDVSFATQRMDESGHEMNLTAAWVPTCVCSCAGEAEPAHALSRWLVVVSSMLFNGGVPLQFVAVHAGAQHRADRFHAVTDHTRQYRRCATFAASFTCRTFSSYCLDPGHVMSLAVWKPDTSVSCAVERTSSCAASAAAIGERDTAGSPWHECIAGELPTPRHASLATRAACETLADPAPTMRVPARVWTAEAFIHKLASASVAAGGGAALPA